MLRFYTLGHTDLRGEDDVPLDAVLSGPKRLALLAYLALAHPRGFHRRDSLLPLLWPHSDQAHARGSLRNLLHQTRSALGKGVIVSRGSEEIGLVAGTLWCDAVAFEEALEADRLREAVELYRGDLLEGFHVPDAGPAFEHWLDKERDRLRRRATEAIWALAEAAESSGDSVEAAQWGRRAVDLSPWDEAALRRSLRLLERVEGPFGALSAYEKFAAHLHAECEEEPSAETQALAAELRERHARGQESIASSGEPAPERDGAASPAGKSEVQRAQPAPEQNAVPGPRPLSARGRGSFLRTAAIIIALLGVTIAVIGSGERSQTDLAEADSFSRVLVFPFENGGSDHSAYLGEGMARLLSTNLDGAGELRSVDPHALLGWLAGSGDATTGGAIAPERAQAAAQHFGAEYYVIGSVLENGGKLQITATLYDRVEPKRPWVEASVRGDPSDLFRLVDELTAELLARSMRAPDEHVSRIALLTTRSVPALKAYLVGENAFRDGDYRGAATAMQQAVELDTAFALAHYRLGLALEWDGRTSSKPAQAAVRHADKLPRRERLLVEANTAYYSGDRGQAEELYRAVIREYPNALDAWYGLGEVLFHHGPLRGRPIVQARHAFDRALALDPNHLGSILHLARIALTERDAQTFHKLEKRYRALSPDGARTLELRALSAAIRGDRAEERRTAEALLAHGVQRLWLTAWRVAIYAGDVRAAQRLMTHLPLEGQPSEFQSAVHISRAHLELARGRWRQAQSELALASLHDPASALRARARLALHHPFLSHSAAELEPLRRALLNWDAEQATPSNSALPPWHAANVNPAVRLYLLGVVSVRVGDVPEAERLVEELESMEPLPEVSAYVRILAPELRAEVLRRSSDVEGALQALQGQPTVSYGTGASPFYASVRARFMRAELLHSLGRKREALGWYASTTEDFAFAIPFVAPAHLRRAEIHDQLGNGDAAVQNYTRFVELWEDCDPELRPLVKRARDRLQQLESTRIPVSR